MKRVIVFLVVLTFSALLVSDAFARLGGGRSSGMRSYSSPRINTPQQMQNPAAPQPAMPQPAAPRPSFFNSGIFKFLMGGLLFGALFSMLTGAGFEGFGSPGLLEILLIAGVIYFIYRRFTRAHKEQAMTYSGPAAGASAAAPDYGSSKPDVDPSLVNESFIKDIAKNSFKSLQSAWSKGDLSSVRPLMTERMYNYLEEQLGKLRSDGLRNIVEIVYFQNVELVETDAEDDVKVAVVQINAMLRDYVVNAQDRIVDGSKDTPIEMKEYWAFVGKGLDWKLDDIKQVE